MTNSTRTFGEELRIFLKKGTYSEFALQTHRTTQYVSYVVCSKLDMDTSGKTPVRAYFEQHSIQLPIGGEPCYSTEIKILFKKIKNTTEILSGNQ